MKKISITIAFLIAYSCSTLSQTFPKEGSRLNYRLIGFLFPPGPQKTNKCILEIANGRYNSEDSFSKNIIVTGENKENKLIAEVPAFGSRYTWRVVYKHNNKSEAYSPLYHFRTRPCPEADTSFFRLRILDTAQKFKDAYVFIDDSKVLCDMKGRVVWFLPKINGISITPRDIKLSPQGTITFLYAPPYEINYNGDVLWKAPQKGIVSGDYSEHFHHEFTRLANGHYMALGIDSALWKHKLPANKNSLAGKANKHINDTGYWKMPFGSLIEYDEKGNVVWSWKSSDYFAGSDLRYFTPHDGRNYYDVHENAFYFDEKNNNIYISFKNISRILKVKYPEGAVIASYGETFKPGEPEHGNGMYCGQHACKYSDNGYLYLYNNNPCDSASLPRIEKLKEPGAGQEGLQKIWDYECTIKGLNPKQKRNYRFISGGNVEELPDSSIFVCMSSIYSKLFIVSPDKKILWSALPERWNASEKRWTVVSQYRASIIYNHKDLERLIWNGTNYSLPANLLKK